MFIFLAQVTKKIVLIIWNSTALETCFYEKQRLFFFQTIDQMKKNINFYNHK